MLFFADTKAYCRRSEKVQETSRNSLPLTHTELLKRERSKAQAGGRSTVKI